MEGGQRSTLVDYKRQIRLFNPRNFSKRVTIIGLGNIGSHSALTLTRLGITDFVLYDFDQVERHNLTSQAYDVTDLGENKAVSLAKKMVNMNPGAKIDSRAEKYENQEINGILIIAVDTMAERKRIHEVLTGPRKELPELIIDARVGGGQLEIYTCKTMGEWKRTFTDNPSHDPCGGRFICYTSVVTGALITNTVKRYLKGESINSSVLMHLDTMEVVKNLEM